MDEEEEERMKRLIGWLLALAMMISAMPALAEAAETAEEHEEYEFSFRNGVAWGIEIEDLIAAEGREPDDDHYDEEIAYVYYMDVQVSNYQGHISYAFFEDELMAAVYALENLPDDDYGYLTRALASKYGEEALPDAARQQVIFELLGGIEQEPEESCCWSLEDGTYITAFRLDDGYASVCFILYVNEADLLEKNGIYNVAGL